MKLDDRQIELYSRQILLRELGGVGQRRLLEARCMLAGDGVGLATAATYLGGAGIGAIDLLPAAGSASATRWAADAGYAALRERAADTALRVLAARRPLDLTSYDALVVAVDEETLPANEVSLQSASGRPRLGSALLWAPTPAAVDLVLLPAGAAGCFACAGVAPRAPEPTGAAPGFPAGERAVVLRLAGAMAALAVLRWAAAIALDAAPRALRLAAGAPTWTEAPPARRPPCPRGCPS